MEGFTNTPKIGNVFLAPKKSLNRLPKEREEWVNHNDWKIENNGQ